MKEKSITVFKYGQDKYKLLEITHDEKINDIIIQYGRPTITGKHRITYLIVKNRRRIAQSIWESTAKRKFANLIAAELMQQKISF